MLDIYVLSWDREWAAAIGKMAGPDVAVHPLQCARGDAAALDYLPAADAQALVLVDAGDFPSLVATVHSLRQRGWRHVVVVAAQIAWREARAVLADGGAADYWAKSYDPDVVRRDVADIAARMTNVGLRSRRRRRNDAASARRPGQSG